MAAITFDTHKFIQRLKAAGFTEPQAEAFTEAQKELFSATETLLATKADIYRLESEIRLLKWMTGTCIGGIIAILVRLFIK